MKHFISTLLFCGIITTTVSAQTTTPFLTLGEGNSTGDGTFIGMSSYSTQPCNTKSFALEHHFYGYVNSSINFFRGGSATGGFLTFSTNDNSEKMRIDANGNVGIATPIPNARLDVNGNILVHSSGAYYNNVGAAELQIGYGLANPGTVGSITRFALQPYAHTGGPWNFISRDDATNAWLDIKYGTTTGITLRNEGNVGIGTTNPQYKLDINGELKVGGIQLVAYSPVLFSAGDINHGIRYAGSYSNFANALLDGPVMYGYSGGALGVKQGTTEAIALRWTGAGNVGIGTLNPAYKLDVLGTIRAKEVLVNLDGGADFVFEKDYKLPTIEHVANYVQENKHLPDIPSANEMVKNGVSISDLQVKLLQKVEELTLYMIGQQKTIDQQQTQIKELNNKLSKLNKQ